MAVIEKIFLLTVFSILLALSHGYIQELQIYHRSSDNDPVVLSTIYTHVPKIGDLNLGQVEQVCSVGFWRAYNVENYESDYVKAFYSFGPSLFCENITEDDPYSEFTYKSIRHVGVLATDNDGLSLYEKVGFEGKELLVVAPSVANINTPIASASWTGSSGWTLFSGTNFNGSQACLPAPSFGEYDHNYHLSLLLELETVGSVRKGCDEEQGKRRSGQH